MEIVMQFFGSGTFYLNVYVREESKLDWGNTSNKVVYSINKVGSSPVGSSSLEGGTLKPTEYSAQYI